MKETTKTEQILQQEGVTIQELINIAREELSKQYYNYPRVKAEFDLDDLIQDILLYFLQSRKDGSQRFEYYASGGRTYIINMFKQACRQNIPALTRYNFLKHKALSLNTTMKDDSETEYIENIVDDHVNDTKNLNESLDDIFALLYEQPKQDYLLKKKEANPNITDLEMIVDVNVRIDLCKIREKAEIEKKIINLLLQGYKMKEVKKILDCSDLDIHMSSIKQVFAKYYALSNTQ